MRKIFGLALAVVAATGQHAGAATIAEPADGVSAIQGSAVHFDWAWADDEYATASIVFTRTADLGDPVWMYGGGQPPRPDRKIMTSEYGSFLSSNANLVVRGFEPGDWYWRLCNKSIYGEDDKCSYDAGVPARRLTVIDGPDCADGLDNDGDGRPDWPYDPGCADYSDIDEADPPPAPPPPPPDPQPVVEPELAFDEAAEEADFALGLRFGLRAPDTMRQVARGCTRVARSTITCRPAWRHGRLRFSGRITVRSATNNGVARLAVAGTIRRRVQPCWRAERVARRCVRTISVSL